MERVDWGATSLGPRDGWSQSLRSAVGMVLSSRFSMWMAWGPELTMFYNDAYARDTLNTKHPWALGRPAQEVWAEIWPDIGPRIEHVMTTGEATWDEALLLFLERSGYREETYHTFSYSPLADDDGSTSGMLCVVVEETDRVLGERRLATLGNLAAALGSAEREADVDQAVERTLSQNDRDLPFALTYRFDDDGSARITAATGGLPAAALDPALWAGRTVDLAGLGIGPVGAWDAPPDEAVVLPLIDPTQDRPAGLLVAGINPFRELDDAYANFLELVAGQIAASTASVRAREADRRRAEALAELDRTKTAFFQNVSHEFRTPLSLILGPAEDALADAETPARREQLSVVLRNALRLQKLVNNLLDFSRLEAGLAEPVREVTDLGVFTADLASMFRSATERAGIDLVVEVPDEPLWIAVDRPMWERIVLNLVSNAFKFTLSGEIDVRLADVDGHVELAVRDTGTGIPPDEIGRLFERFRRVRGAQSRTHEGSGIGLALVQELTRLHGGDVRVDSVPGEGSTFTVALPHDEAVPAGDAPAAPTSQAAAYVEEALRWLPQDGDFAERDDVVGAGLAAAGRNASDRAHVLVADDNADLREYLGRLLEGSFSVETVADGRAALAAVADHRPDLIVSDAMMPEMDGFELLAALRADPSTAQLPVILLSARAGEESAVEGLAAGADDYLVKPFSSRELLARVHACLDLAELRQAAALATERHAQLLRDLAEAAIAINRVRTVPEVLDAGARFARELVGAPWALVSLDERHGGQAVVSGDDPGPERRGVLRVELAGRVRLGELLLPAGDRVGGVEADAVMTQLAQVTSARLENAMLFEREHRVAETLQRSLLPASLPEVAGGDLAAVYLPGSAEAEVGGDWYDAFALGDDRLALVIGDVVGRGVKAASMMGQLRNAVRAYVLEGYGPADTLTRVNRLVETLGGGFATVFCALVDLGSGEMRFSTAGHPPPLVLDGNGASLIDGPVSPPIGAAVGVEYREGTAEIPRGGALVLYTDGLVERRDEPLDTGFDRMIAAALRGPQDATGLAAHLVTEMPGSERPDDVAVLAFARAGLPGDPLSLRIEPSATALAPMRRRLRRWLADAGAGEELSGDLLLAAGEAAGNAIEHAVAPDPAMVAVSARVADGAVVIEVRDYGSWREGPSAPHRGHGLGIMDALADDLQVVREPEGTTVRITRRLT
jgi:signal transduction histidine kinase/serine phosphatase RsbU (regulator of sigma subunit)/CheY-like chemotaxis protein